MTDLKLVTLIFFVEFESIITLFLHRKRRIQISKSTIASTPAITFEEENTTELVKSLTSLQRLGTRTIDNSADETLSTFSKKRMNVQKVA